MLSSLIKKDGVFFPDGTEMHAIAGSYFSRIHSSVYLASGAQTSKHVLRMPITSGLMQTERDTKQVTHTLDPGGLGTDVGDSRISPYSTE